MWKVRVKSQDREACSGSQAWTAGQPGVSGRGALGCTRTPWGPHPEWEMPASLWYRTAPSPLPHLSVFSYLAFMSVDRSPIIYHLCIHFSFLC